MCLSSRIELKRDYTLFFTLETVSNLVPQGFQWVEYMLSQSWIPFRWQLKVQVARSVLPKSISNLIISHYLLSSKAKYHCFTIGMIFLSSKIHDFFQVQICKSILKDNVQVCFPPYNLLDCRFYLAHSRSSSWEI